MIGFKNFIIENEIKTFAINLDEMSPTESPLEAPPPKDDRSDTPKTGVPPVSQKGGNIWHKVKAGADKYFNASPEEQQAMRKEARKVLGKNNLLGNEASNPKLAKSGKKIPEYKTKGLSFAPSTMSGIDVCPAATKECKAACLGKSAGRGVMKGTRKGRVNKTLKYFKDPHLFYAKLDQEIENSKKTATRKDQKFAVRLNVMSDIPHEHFAPKLFQKHSDVSFYDYTKIAGRTTHKNKPDNYHLTLSSTGLNHPYSNWKQVRKHLDNGGVAAMAFNDPSIGKGSEVPFPTHVHDEETGKKYRVVDGDEHDHRHLDKVIHDIPDHEGVIAGLKFKGGRPNIERAGNFAVPHEGGIATAKKDQNK